GGRGWCEVGVSEGGGAEGGGGVEAVGVPRELGEIAALERRHTHLVRESLARRKRPRQLQEKSTLRERRRRVVRGDCAERQVEERRRDLRVDQLVRLHLPVSEVEERLPADEPARRAEAAP